MIAGVPVGEECIQEFTALRMKRAHRYLIMKVSQEGTKIELEKAGERSSTFEDFKESMPKDACR